MSPSVQPGVDGRLTRTVRSRLAICEACVDLLQEGVLQPGADQIAERAGVSRRSVFNHFNDLAELYDAVVEVGIQRCAPLLREIPVGDPIRVRLDALIEIRSKFLEATSPFTRALTAQSLVGPAAEQARRVSLDALEQQFDTIATLFQDDLTDLPETEQQEILEAMSAATNPLVWEYLRHSRGMSITRARAVMKRSLVALLRDAGVALP